MDASYVLYASEERDLTRDVLISQNIEQYDGGPE